MTSVYVAACGDRFVKIGVSKDAEKRIDNLSKIVGRPLKLIHLEVLESPMAAKHAEQRALWCLRELCIGGEWFECSVSEAVNAVKSAGMLAVRGELKYDYRMTFVARDPGAAIAMIRDGVEKPPRKNSVRKFSPDSEREVRYVERRRNGGSKRVTLWIDPEDLDALATITERAGGSTTIAIRQAIRDAAK